MRPPLSGLFFKKMIIFVYYTSKNKTIEKNINRELIWYDPIKKEIQVFYGGQLSFKYKNDNYLKEKGYKNTFRLLPEVENIKIKEIEKVLNKEEIIKWFKNYQNYNNTDIFISDINNKYIEFNVPNNEKDDFIDDLHRKRFDYQEV
jgi:hypothetical protein